MQITKKETAEKVHMKMSALKKIYEYDIKNIPNIPNLTQERVNRYVEEMSKSPEI